MKDRRFRPWIWRLGFLALVPATFLLAEMVYYARIYTATRPAPVKGDLVLVYSGGENREKAVRGWPGPKTLFLFSGEGYRKGYLEAMTGLPGDRILVEDRARTTDQNIRYALPLIRKSGARRLVLALPWYHLPRALFLTRWYLRGMGLSVLPCATTLPPARWWRTWDFWKEAIKFWGSLLRVVLAYFGVENWPEPYSINWEALPHGHPGNLLRR